MSADTTEQDAAGGDELRSRYLPVSRKELRRRREEELAQQRSAQEQAEATSDQLAESTDDPDPEDSAETEAEDELARAVQDTGAVEALELPAPPQRPQETAETTGSHESYDEVQPAEELTVGDEIQGAEAEGAEADEGAAADTETEDEMSADEVSSDEIGVDAPEAELPEPVTTDEPARPEEEVADAAEAEEPDVALSADEVAALTAEQDEELLDEAGEAGVDTEDEDSDVDGHQAEDTEHDAPEFIDEQDAPIPASRRARRLLRATSDLPKLAPELVAELNQTTSEIAMNDDPNRVDPELLKKQQALAAKAMQANQERMRQQQAESARVERRRERPESEVITGKALRDSPGTDSDEADFLTGQIAPVHAEGAHGLDLNEMLDETSRQAGRQGALMWVAVVLAVLLLVAVLVIFIL